MNYNQLSKKGQEDRSHLFADIFGILIEGLYTSVVNPLLKMITGIIGNTIVEAMFPIIDKKPNDVVVTSSHTFRKICLS